MFYEDKEKKIYTGGEDGVINVLLLSSSGLSLKGKLLTLDLKLSQNPAIRSLDFYCGRALIGTMGSELFFIDNID